ncbi:BON domain-containing protein [Lichenifustis flavocetrariae]|uniref:BON domain-containing protein n=1 Tax=Lichenifustis flavocetrariae TaxID=2949735 RepID=A0AA41Z032_9HYPH|nr:BON domain-containing protein [Lichenifustis flavocetrariae]MCW6511744.1 BON domain-containing protein [Lichenifustis flavocetrariae]
MIHDRDLQKSVLAELSWDPSVTAAHIGVTADQGVVSLSGHVESYGEKHAAEAATRRVKGVKAVVEELEVRLKSDCLLNDDDIAREAIGRLAWHVVDPEYKVAIKVEKGWMTLSGQVEWHFQKEATESEIRRLPGVVGLDNQITIKPRVIVSNVSDDITHALHRSWFFDPKTIDVSAEAGTIRLNGTVRSSHERKLAAQTAWAAPGVTMVENNLSIV